MMRKMDEILDKTYSDKGAYRVPEGYFSTLNQRIMNAIPEEETEKGRKLARIIKIKNAVAACLVGVMMGAGTLIYFAHDKQNTMTLANNDIQETITDEYVDECMDYAMVGNNDIYIYLAEQ